MNNLRRLLGNVPVQRFGVAVTLAAALAIAAVPALLMAPSPALAAEELGVGDMPELPADVSPAQAEAVRQILESDAGAKKLVEAAQQQKEQAA